MFVGRARDEKRERARGVVCSLDRRVFFAAASEGRRPPLATAASARIESPFPERHSAPGARRSLGGGMYRTQRSLFRGARLALFLHKGASGEEKRQRLGRGCCSRERERQGAAAKERARLFARPPRPPRASQRGQDAARSLPEGLIRRSRPPRRAEAASRGGRQRARERESSRGQKGESDGSLARPSAEEGTDLAAAVGRDPVGDERGLGHRAVRRR